MDNGQLRSRAPSLHGWAMTSQATDIDSSTAPRASTAPASPRLSTCSIAIDSSDMIMTIPASAQDWTLTGQETVGQLMSAAMIVQEAATKMFQKIEFKLSSRQR